MWVGRLWFWLSDQGKSPQENVYKLRPGGLEAISYERRDVVESSKKREQHGSET